MLGGGLAYTIYITLAKTYFIEVWLPPVILIVALTLAIAFIKVNGIPFLKFVTLILEFHLTPRKRKWVQGGADPLHSAFQFSTKTTKPDKKSDKKKAQIKPTIDQLDEITKILDTHGMNN